MSFRDTLTKFRNKAEQKIQDLQSSSPARPPQSSSSYYPYQQQQEQQQYHRPPPPPPIPHGSKPQPQYYGGPPSIAPAFAHPSGPPPPHPPTAAPSWGTSETSSYWTPRFRPDVAVSESFAYDEGNSVDGWGNHELQHYTTSPTNSFYVQEGKLIIRAHANSHAPTPQERYTSARLVSRQKLERSRGYVYARLTSPCARGVWPAFWLLPEEPSTWPGDGEIDIFEDWNGLRTNHSCLHWGHYNGEDWNKHRVADTPIPYADDPSGREYGFAWVMEADGRRGRMVWYIDGRPVMKHVVPEGVRPVSDFQVVLNVALGGNVCQGAVPADGWYDMVVHELRMMDGIPGGWGRFEHDWHKAPEGHPC